MLPAPSWHRSMLHKDVLQHVSVAIMHVDGSQHYAAMVEGAPTMNWQASNCCIVAVKFRVSAILDMLQLQATVMRQQPRRCSAFTYMHSMLMCCEVCPWYRIDMLHFFS